MKSAVRRLSLLLLACSIAAAPASLRAQERAMVAVTISRSGSKSSRNSLVRRSKAANASRPSFVNEKPARFAAGTLSGVAAPIGLPVFPSIGMRQRFITPPRSLTKYSQRPSGETPLTPT